MSNEQILTKAIEKAALAGWELPGYKMYPHDDYEIRIDEEIGMQPGNFEETGQFILFIDGSVNPMHFNQVIFDHDFARALWGEQGYGGEFTGKYPNPIIDKRGGYQRGWQYHLQQMVIAEDPIAYLEANI